MQAFHSQNQNINTPQPTFNINIQQQFFRNDGNNPWQNLLQQFLPPMFGSGGNIDDILNQLFENARGQGAPPASDNAIKALEKKIITSKEVEKTEDCPICKDDFVLDEEVIEMGCSHRFHPDCLTRWLKMRNTCPVCRYEIESATENGDNEDTTSNDNNTADYTSTNSSDSAYSFYM
eukprot:CAMPEP_0174253686 /NCGR_PEP_ID=MMETSP0439-20130205/3054_1 /TAXON_ID=0 /ORGANISM="Stereomyxa ramosa, Strain Chinc5" /LENGTH=176 /DNA_ID=CAMNT_0015334849 /DNA_START=307 /DNA_END=837 /DNA_ORIENTATION=+